MVAGKEYFAGSTQKEDFFEARVLKKSSLLELVQAA